MVKIKRFLRKIFYSVRLLPCKSYLRYLAVPLSFLKKYMIRVTVNRIKMGQRELLLKTNIADPL